MRTYEAMFLLQAGQADFETALAPVRTILERSGAQVLHLKKWDERRLAYDIAGQRRGLYVLSYFQADPQKIAEIERDARLNEDVLRLLILSADHLDQERMAAATPAEAEASRRERHDRHKTAESEAAPAEAAAELGGAAEAVAAEEQAPAEEPLDDQSA